MLFYSRKSSRRVTHLADCHYWRGTKKDAVGTFQTLQDAQAAGYRLCRCCAPTGKCYRRESRAINAFCADYGVACRYYGDMLQIVTPYSKWRIQNNNRVDGLSFYHRNTENRPDSISPIPGYHDQRVRKDTILEYLQYIVDHDAYRIVHPLRQKPTPKPAPQKGTKRYRKALKRQKRLAHRQETRRVLELIDRLSLAE